MMEKFNKVWEASKTVIVNAMVVIAILSLLCGLFLGVLSKGSIELLFSYFKGNFFAVLLVGFIGFVWISLTGITITTIALPEPAISKVVGLLFGAGSVATGLALVIITFFLAGAVALFLLAFSFLSGLIALIKYYRLHKAMGIIGGCFFTGAGILVGYLGYGPPLVVPAMICSSLWVIFGVLYFILPFLPRGKKQSLEGGQ